MLPNEIGMNTDRVRINSIKLDYYVSTDKKIESDLNIVIENCKNAYSSSNSTRMNINNQSILEAFHIKVRNLNSYKLYIDKYILKYTNVGIIAEEESNIIKPLGI